MSITHTTTPPSETVGKILLHPRPAARNSGVLVLVPLLASLPSESHSPTLRVIADAESFQRKHTIDGPFFAGPDQQVLIAGLPYTRSCARVNGDVPPADSRLSHKLAVELPLLGPRLSDVPCTQIPGPPPLHTDEPLKRTTEESRKSPPRPPKTLTFPAETWLRVLAFVFAVPPVGIEVEERRARAGLLRVSKTFKNLVSPLFYAYPYLSTPPALTDFTCVLQTCDRAWDSLRRIPYSTPGRWVQALDLSRVSCTTPGERLAVDTLLTHLFPLTPFLTRLVLNNTVRMSTRAMAALASRESADLLRVLKGVKWEKMEMTVWNPLREDPLLALVRASIGLEELEVFGPGLQDDEEEDGPMTPQLHTPPPTPLPPLFLPRLHSLMILSLPKAPLLSSLVRSPLPSLRHLMVTPYDDVPSALTSSLVATHGAALHTLAFHTPKIWPPIRGHTPPTLLHTSPRLRALSLTFPLPLLTAPPSAPAMGHPLQILSLPRPDPTYLYKLEAWLYLGLLQSLEEIHMREVRWIRAGLSNRAAEAGVQGEMKEWKRRLGRWRVRIMDVSGQEDLLSA